MNEIFVLTKQELEQVTEIMDLYEMIATKSLGKVTEDTSYDCREISVSENIYDLMEGKHRSCIAFSIEWICYGPKIDYSLPENTVVIKENFC